MQQFHVFTSKQQVEGVSPLDCFLRLSQRLGRERVFMLESLSACSADAKLSVIGVNPLLQIRSIDRRIEVSGGPELVSEVIAAARSVSGLTLVASQEILLSEQRTVWDFLRLVRGLFDWRERATGRSFTFGLFGYLGYDVAWKIETLARRIDQTNQPYDMVLGLYQAVVEVNKSDNLATVKVNNCLLWPDMKSEWLGEEIRNRAQGNGAQEFTEEATISHAAHGERVIRTTNPDEFFGRVRVAREHIRQGDIYQVQLGHEIAIESTTDQLAVYMRMRDRNPSPFMFFAQILGDTIIGASPELFVRIVDGKVTMRPIAGTCRRGRSWAENARLIDEMRNDEKEVAEHIMLVDLCRNDIGRICRPGSLRVSSLMEAVTYSHVNHLVSTVTGELAEEFDCFDVIRATFPAGTMTGAPKIRAIEIIEDLETSRRGVYAGAVGVIGFDGYLNTALCIRSAVYNGQRYSIRASAGIVADSTPEREWHETLHKMAGPYWAITTRELTDESPID